jgi:hypothetical protein
MREDRRDGSRSLSYCNNIQHTRTVLILHVATVDGRPKVTVRNFGNHG